MKRPIGFFCHHQGRGHIQRATLIINQLPNDIPVTVFCADTAAFGELPEHVTLVAIESLFEINHNQPQAFEVAQPTPSVFHNVPMGWPSITRSVAIITEWFAHANPALFVVDVSAEIAQLCRISSVAAVHIRQHGDRSDPAHQAAYESCIGLLAPYDQALEHESTADWVIKKTHYMGGQQTERLTRDISLIADSTDSQDERLKQKLGIDPQARVISVISGSGGSGANYAALTLAARALPDYEFHLLGPICREGHETDCANLVNHGWVDNPQDFIRISKLVIASAGNSTVHEILSLAKPYLCIPEWRYFDEQRFKAQALDQAGAAVWLESYPGSPAQWRAAIARALKVDPKTQLSLVTPKAAQSAAAKLTDWYQLITQTVTSNKLKEPRKRA